MNVVRYYETEDGADRRLVEHRKKEKVSTGSGRFDYKYRTKRRWLAIEEYQNGSWTEIEELGDYLDPKEAPHK